MELSKPISAASINAALGFTVQALTESNIDGAVTGLARCATGTYTGNNTVNRSIPHGLGVVPSVVILCPVSSATHGEHAILTDGKMSYCDSSSDALYDVTSMDSTNFYVGNSTAYDDSMNATGYTYRYVVIA